MTTTKSHDASLARLPPDQHDALQTLRAQIRAAAPAAREVFSYGIPAFRVGPGPGKVLVGYAAMTAHCGLYVFEGNLVARFAARLEGFPTSKGTIRFTPDHPLPEAVVHDMVTARLTDIV